MKQSLKEKLNNLIRQKGRIEYNELKGLVESNFFGKFYRISTAERRLRNESPEVEAEMKDGYIVAYRWVGKPLVFREVKVLDSVGNTIKVIQLPI